VYVDNQASVAANVDVKERVELWKVHSSRTDSLPMDPGKYLNHFCKTCKTCDGANKGT